MRVILDKSFEWNNTTMDTLEFKEIGKREVK